MSSLSIQYAVEAITVRHDQSHDDKRFTDRASSPAFFARIENILKRGEASHSRATALPSFGSHE